MKINFLSFFLLLSVFTNAQQKMYWATLDGIFKSNLWGTTTESIVLASRPAELVLNPNDGKIYYIDTNKKAIFKCDKDGNNLSVYKDGFIAPTDFAYSKSENAFYCVDDKKIIKVKSDLTTQIILSGLTAPHSIALDEANGIIFWSDHKDNDIKTCTLTGTNKKSIIEDLSYPKDLAIENNRLYYLQYCGADFCSDISSVNFDGTSKRKIITIYSSNMAIHNGYIYYINSLHLNDLERVTINGTGTTTMCENLKYLTGMAFDEANNKIICLGDYAKILFNINLSSQTNKPSFLIEDKVAAPSSVVFDSLNQKMLWINRFNYDRHNPAIVRANFDGSNIEIIQKENDVYYYNIAIVNNKLFWSTRSGIYKSDVDGKNSIKIVDGFITDFVLNSQKIIFYQYDKKILNICNLDGSDNNSLSGTNYSVQTMELDKKNNLYFYEHNNQQILKMSLSTNKLDTILSSASQIFYIHIDETNSKIFTVTDLDEIKYANLDGSNYKIVKEFTRYSGINCVILDNVKTTSSVDVSKEQAYISVFPNPTNNVIYIKNDSSTKNGKAQVFDLNGRLIKEKQVSESINYLDCGDIEKGIYILKINWQNGDISTTKFSKL